MLFHAGALWRLCDAGLLPSLDLVSCVSGGAIAGAALALAWDRLGDPAAFEGAVVAPLRRLASRTVDVPAALLGAVLPGGPGARLARAYDRDVCDGATLQDLPERPHVVFLATSLQTGELWRFGRAYMAEGRVGRVDRPTVPLAVAVAASSAFPPFLAPLRLRLGSQAVPPVDPGALQDPAYTERAVLVDGGVYDNLGLEPAWRHYETVLVSDAGAAFAPQPYPAAGWGRLGLRVLGVVDSQVRALRRRQIATAFARGERSGVYWSIREARPEAARVLPPGSLPCPPHRTRQLASVPTRLARLDPALQERLVNWGYAACDRAVRRHPLMGSGAQPSAFPYPDAGV